MTEEAVGHYRTTGAAVTCFGIGSAAFLSVVAATGPQMFGFIEFPAALTICAATVLTGLSMWSVRAA